MTGKIRYEREKRITCFTNLHEIFKARNLTIQYMTDVPVTKFNQGSCVRTFWVYLHID